jgi:hypothetical protein
MNKTETSRVSLIEQPNFGCSRYVALRDVLGELLGGLENFEKLDPISCNLSELKVILLNWKKTFFGRRIFFYGVFLHLTSDRKLTKCAK